MPRLVSHAVRGGAGRAGSRLEGQPSTCSALQALAEVTLSGNNRAINLPLVHQACHFTLWYNLAMQPNDSLAFQNTRFTRRLGRDVVCDEAASYRQLDHRALPKVLCPV